MCRKVLTLIIVLAVVGIASAHPAFTGAIDNYWSNAGNWDSGHVPLTTERATTPYAPGVQCTITGGDWESHGLYTEGGAWESDPAKIGQFKMTGGTLTSSWNLNWGGIGPTEVIIEGGTISSPAECSVGYLSTGKLYMSGGLLNPVLFHMATAWTASDHADSYVRMTGGTIDTSYVHITERGGTTNKGRLDLLGGEIKTSNLTDGLPNGALYVAGNGILNIAGGTVTMLGDHQTAVADMITAGNIIAFNGEGTVNVQYIPPYEEDPALTILTGVPEPATIALLGLGGLALLRKRR